MRLDQNTLQIGSSSRVSEFASMDDEIFLQREKVIPTRQDHDVSSFWLDLNSLNTLENMSTFDSMMCNLCNFGFNTKKNKFTIIKKRIRKKCTKK